MRPIARLTPSFSVSSFSTCTFARVLLFFSFSLCALAQVPTISVQTGSPNVLQEGGTTTITCTANCAGLTWQVNKITGGNSTVGTITGNNSTATYTAPASIVANDSYGGCPASFNDAIWNVPVSVLPLISNWTGDPFLNDAWFQFYTTASFLPGHISGALGLTDVHHLTLVNNASQTVNFNSSYSGAVANFPWPFFPTHMRESGVYNNDFVNVDTHSALVNIQNCKWYEMYNDHVANYQSPTSACQSPVTGNCYGSSSWTTQAATTSQSAYFWVGGTGAGGNPLFPYLIHLSEVKKGVINHAVYLRPPRDVLRGNCCKTGDRMWPATYATGYCNVKEIVGLSGFPTGSGYSSSTTITFSGGGGSGTTWTPIITGGVITGATMTHSVSTGWSSTPSVVITDPNGTGSGASLTATIDYPCMPYGSRIALDQTYYSTHAGSGCSAGSNCITGDGLTVATALANYGGIVLDNCCTGSTWTVDADFDLEQDETAVSSITSMLSHMTFNRFHVYDQSNLAVSTADGINKFGSSYGGIVKDNDLGYIPPGAVWITATNTSGASQSTQLALDPPTIGTPDAEIPILAGDYSGSKGTGGGYQIPYWVNGASNPAVTWTCATCAANGSSITTGGIYTPPLTVSAPPGAHGGSFQDVAVVTLNADPNITEAVYLNVLPNSGNYAANTVRIDTANYTAGGYGPDGNGHYWLSRVGGFLPQPDNITESWAYYKAPQGCPSPCEKSVYNSEVTSFGPGDLTYKIIVPNGQYKVRVMSGWDPESASISTTAANHSPLVISGEDDGTGGIKILHWPMMLQAAYPFATQSNSDAIFGELVSDNVLWASVQTDYLGNPDHNIPPQSWPGWVNCTNMCKQQAIMSGLDVEPDSSTAPHWTIGVTNWANSPTTPTNFLALSEAPVIAPGKQLLLYRQDWYTGLNDPVFSIVRGPGSIQSSPVMLQVGQAMPAAVYTAPTTVPYGNDAVFIKAQSQSNPSISATIQVRLYSGPSTPVFFK